MTTTYSFPHMQPDGTTTQGFHHRPLNFLGKNFTEGWDPEYVRLFAKYERMYPGLGHTFARELTKK